MTASPPIVPLDANVESLASDERALEQLFRTHFLTLAEEAREKLGEAASAAPRVVESAFRQVWEARRDPGANLGTESELVTGLRDAVHHAAAREISRRTAAQHLAGKKVVANGRHAAPVSLDVDQAWAELTRRLHPDPVARGHAARAHAEIVRHDAAEHIARVAKRRSWRAPLVIGAVSLALAGAGIWWLTRSAAESAITRALASPDTRYISTSIGQIANITLDDSTKVTLAPSSRLAIPPRYGEKLRAVRLEGTAAFAVAAGPSAPFQVRAGSADVKVAGTTLRIRAFPNETAVTVYVTAGQATVKSGGVDYPLAAGNALHIENTGQVREPSPSELAEAISWTDGTVTITNRRLGDLVPHLNRWYGLDIKLPDTTLADRVGTVEAPLDSLRAAIADVEQSAGVEFGYEGKTMVFKAGKARTARRQR